MAGRDEAPSSSLGTICSSPSPAGVALVPPIPGQTLQKWLPNIPRNTRGGLYRTLLLRNSPIVTEIKVNIGVQKRGTALFPAWAGSPHPVFPPMVSSNHVSLKLPGREWEHRC